MKTQLEFLKLAVQLAEANPNMKIKVFTNYEELSDDYAWQEQKIYSVSVEDYYLHNDERILIDEDDIRDAIAERFEDDVEHTDEEIEKKFVGMFVGLTSVVSGISDIPVSALKLLGGESKLSIAEILEDAVVSLTDLLSVVKEGAIIE